MSESDYPKTLWNAEGITIEVQNKAEHDACTRGGWMPGDPNEGKPADDEPKE